MSTGSQVSVLTHETQLVLALTSAPSHDVARQIARNLVEEKLAACVNLIPAVQSVYQWEGEVREESEILCLMKTSRPLLPQLNQRLQELHPYEVPEVVVVAAEAVSTAYERWVQEATRVYSPEPPQLP